MSVKVCYVDVLCTLRSPLLHLSKKKKKKKNLQSSWNLSCLERDWWKMKKERLKVPWYQVRDVLLFQRGDMDAFWTGDFHYHMSVSKSKAWSQGFGWWVLPSGGEGRLPMLQSRLETRATSSCSIVGCLLTWGLKYRVQSRSPNICPQA